MKGIRMNILQNLSVNHKLILGGVTVFGIGLKVDRTMKYNSNKSSFINRQLVRNQKISEQQQQIVDDIYSILIQEDWDYGHIGPSLIRLAWHSSGTYNQTKNEGGPNGATIRFNQEKTDPANAGLDKVMSLLEPIKQKYPDISYSDLYVLASYVAIEDMGGPHIPFRFGRIDRNSQDHCPINGLLPNASLGADHIRQIFNRMGFNDQEMVVLIGGGHAIGKCHKDRSGYDGPWTFQPTGFTNFYFRELLDREWKEKEWNGPKQYEDSTGKLMMLPTDMELKTDNQFNTICQIYQKDQERFTSDFAKAFKKLTENGCFDYNHEYVKRFSWMPTQHN